MTKRRGEPNERHHTSGGVELQPRRRRAGSLEAPFAVTRANSNENFVQAFADALRDILRDERHRTASAA